jgi:hypothetical protein
MNWPARCDCSESLRVLRTITCSPWTTCISSLTAMNGLLIRAERAPCPHFEFVGVNEHARGRLRGRARSRTCLSSDVSRMTSSGGTHPRAFRSSPVVPVGGRRRLAPPLPLPAIKVPMPMAAATGHSINSAAAAAPSAPKYKALRGGGRIERTLRSAPPICSRPGAGTPMRGRLDGRNCRLTKGRFKVDGRAPVPLSSVERSSASGSGSAEAGLRCRALPAVVTIISPLRGCSRRRSALSSK